MKPLSWPDFGHWRQALLATTCLAVVGGVLAPPVAAAPSGLSVGAGQVTVSNPNAQTTLIQQGTGKAVLNWNSFSVGRSESVIFQQPNAASTALNRVTGSQPSSIFGHLTANGQVWLLNPNGILFGRNAVVNVAGFLATTSGINDSDFLAGNYNFGTASPNPNAGIVNHGTIQAADGGSVVLSGAYVQNGGLIQARLGKVVLAGATTFAVDFAGDSLLSFAVTGPVNQVPVDQNGNPVTALVSNTGSIAADGGQVTLTARAAKNILDNVINTTGMIEANTASVVNGTIVLDAGDGGVTVGGGLSATGLNPGETGGTVNVLGGAITIASGATINASGDAGGGSVFIGGNFHGAGPLPNAWTANVQQGATILADAVTYGNGGNVAVWADGYTAFNGTISAQGGALGGNGGFVETSGKQSLTVGDTATVNTLAANGQTGTWLLDPANIVVVATGGNVSTLPDNNPSGGTNNADLSTNNPGGTDTINATAITGSNSNVLLQATVDITFNTGLTFNNNGVGIIAQAGNNITVNSGISTRGGNIELDANDNSFGTATGSGAISIASGVNLTTTGASQTGGSITLKVNGGTGSITDSFADPNSIQTSGGAVAIQNTGTGNVSIAGAVNTVGTASVTSGGVTINSGGNVTVGSGLTTSSNSITTRGFDTAVTTDTPGNGGSVSITAASINLPFGIVTRGGDSTNSNAAWTGSGSALTANGGDAGSITLTATAGAVTVGSATTGNAVGLIARGGNSTGGSGGNGAAINVTGNTIALARALSHGGDTFASSGVSGGNAGSIALAATASSGAAVTLYGNSESAAGADTSPLATLSARGGFIGVAAIGQLSPGTITGSGGNITIGSSLGGAALNGSSDVQLATSSGSNGGSTVTLSVGGGVTGSRGGTLTISGPIDATTANVESLRLAAGDGSAVIGGSVGGGVALNSVTLGSGLGDLPSGGNGGSVTFQGPVTVGTQIIDLRGSGSLTFNGLITTPFLKNPSDDANPSASLAMLGGGVFTGDLRIGGGGNAPTLTLGGNFVLTSSFTGNLSGGNSPNFVIARAGSFDTSAVGKNATLNSIVSNSPFTFNTGSGNLTINSVSSSSGFTLSLRGSGIDTISATSGPVAYDLRNFSGTARITGGTIIRRTAPSVVAALIIPPPPPPPFSFAPPPLPLFQVPLPVQLVSFTPMTTGPLDTVPSDNAPTTVQGTDTGGSMFSQISPEAPNPGGSSGSTSGGQSTTTTASNTSGSGSTSGSTGGTSGTSGSRGAGAAGGTSGGTTTTASNTPTQTPDTGDRAMSVIAQPPPVQPVSHPLPAPAHVTAPVIPGFVNQVQHPVVPKSGTPGVQQSFSSSGNSGRW